MCQDYAGGDHSCPYQHDITAFLTKPHMREDIKDPKPYPAPNQYGTPHYLFQKDSGWSTGFSKINFKANCRKAPRLGTSGQTASPPLPTPHRSLVLGSGFRIWGL